MLNPYAPPFLPTQACIEDRPSLSTLPPDVCSLANLLRALLSIVTNVHSINAPACNTKQVQTSEHF